MAKQKSVRIERGIARLTLKSGAEAFRVQLSGKVVGGRRLSKLVATYAEAQAVKSDWLRGGGPTPGESAPAAAPPEPTVEDGLRLYAAELRRQGKDAGRVLQMIPVLDRVDGRLLALPVARVALGHLYDFRQRREQAGTKPNTIRRDLGVLRSMLKRERPDFAVPDEVFPAGNNTRVRVLAPTEFKAAVLAVPEPFRTMARLAAITLMRLSDIRTLRREMVDLRQGVIFLPETKTGPRPVALGAEAAGLLRTALAASDGSAVVFPNAGGHPYSRVHVSRIWRRAIRGAGRRDFTFHDLKHHGAMRALADGASFPELQGLGGWKTPGMVNRYASVAADRVRELQDRISRATPARARRARG